LDRQFPPAELLKCNIPSNNCSRERLDPPIVEVVAGALRQSIEENMRFEPTFGVSWRRGVVILVLLLTGSFVSTLQAQIQQFPVMHPDQDTLLKWQTKHRTQAEASFDTNIQAQIASTTALSPTANLLPYFTYTPALRNQGGCGDCWVWAFTATAQISLGVNGVNDPLSIQFMNSAKLPYSANNFACCGGSLDEAADWYNQNGAFFVPWSNKDAAYADASKGCESGSSSVSFSSIATSPNHAYKTLQVLTVPTDGVGQATAIANIKNQLAQNHAVAYSWCLPNGTAWDAFFSFWGNQNEAALWNPDVYAGVPFNSATGGCHLTTIVGYDDTSSDPTEHYWTVLNSWGTTAGRPNGIYHLPQMINYDGAQSGIASNWFDTVAISWPTQNKLTFLLQPQNVFATAGMPATLSAAAEGGKLPYLYQWFKDGKLISGATFASYTITSASAANAGSYLVAATDATGTAITSNSATLSLTPPDFTMALSSSAITVKSGTPQKVTVSLAAVGGFNSPVSLAASGQPAGVTIAFSPVSVTASGSSVMTITDAGTGPSGTFPITVTASGGQKTHTAAESLTAESLPTITSLVASPNTITAGQSTTLSWTAAGATILSLSSAASLPATAKSATVSPTATTTYTLTAGNAYGVATASVKVLVLPVISSFAASSQYIHPGQSSQLTWSTAGATSVIITPLVRTGLGAIGTASVTPSLTTTYVLTASNASGSKTATVTVNVGYAPNISSFTASPATITAGQGVTLAWKVIAANSTSISPAVGTLTGTSVVVKPSTSMQYTLTATNLFGTSTAIAKVTISAAAK
jgi:C1A family cysteine protease